MSTAPRPIAQDGSFAEYWRALVDAHPERIAIAETDTTLTWAQLWRDARRLASALWVHGLRPGAVTLVGLTNRVEYLEAVLATALVGGTPANLNYRYREAEIATILEKADPEAVIVEPEQADACTRAIETLAPRRPPWLVTRGPALEQAVAWAAPVGEPWAARRPSGDDRILLFTGGTTGSPKGVVWTQRDLSRALWEARGGEGDPPPAALVAAEPDSGVVLPACPLMHGTGLFMTLSSLAQGATVVLVPGIGLDAAAVWDAVERHRVTTLTVVGDPVALPLLEELDRAPARDVSSLRTVTSSGAPLSAGAKRGLVERLPEVVIVDSLGASEAIAARSVTRQGSGHERSQFRLGRRVRVVDPTTRRDVDAGSGEVGVVAVGGPLPLGYHNDPEATARTFPVIDGIRHAIPGDLARMNADGTIEFLGRGTACINSGGEKVYPEEVERVLRASPEVRDCAVVGVPDPRLGERVAAIVVPAPGSSPSAESIEGWVEERLAGFKRPRHVVIVPTLGRSAAGKLQYPRLRALAARSLPRRTGEAGHESADGEPGCVDGRDKKE